MHTAALSLRLPALTEVGENSATGVGVEVGENSATGVGVEEAVALCKTDQRLEGRGLAGSEEGVFKGPEKVSASAVVTENTACTAGTLDTDEAGTATASEALSSDTQSIVTTAEMLVNNAHPDAAAPHTTTSTAAADSDSTAAATTTTTNTTTTTTNTNTNTTAAADSSTAAANTTVTTDATATSLAEESMTADTAPILPVSDASALSLDPLIPLARTPITSSQVTTTTTSTTSTTSTSTTTSTTSTATTTATATATATTVASTKECQLVAKPTLGAKKFASRSSQKFALLKANLTTVKTLSIAQRQAIDRAKYSSRKFKFSSLAMVNFLRDLHQKSGKPFKPFKPKVKSIFCCTNAALTLH